MKIPQEVFGQHNKEKLLYYERVDFNCHKSAVDRFEIYKIK